LIDNVILRIDDNGRSSFTVTNRADEAIGYDLTPLRWSINDGEDIYSETSEFIAVPPSFRLDAGETMTVRVGFRNPQPQPIERAYRLSVREVVDQTTDEGVSFAFEHMLAAYVKPAGGREPSQVDWSLRRRDDVWEVQAENVGNARAVVQEIYLNGERVQLEGNPTILAKTWRAYPVPASLINGESIVLDYKLKGGVAGETTITN
jgi:P pilus assembly chaperone PapD